MQEVKAFLAFLASLGILSYQPHQVLLHDNTVMDVETLALKSGQEKSLVEAVLLVMANLTTPKSIVMEAIAEEEGMEDFFVAEVSEYSFGAVEFTLYGFEGSVYKTSVGDEDIALMATAHVS